MRCFSVFALICMASIGFSQSELIGPGRFPETREMSGLPGGSFGVLPDGTPSFRPREARSSRSPFVVATANPLSGGYVSLGYGNQRFGGIFGNVSQTFGNFKAVAEYDTYNWNYGVADRLGHFSGFGKDIEATAVAGYIRGKYATWALTLTF